MADHVFICYARQDQDFVLKLAANLKERGARVWLDQWDISPSADWDLTIDNALSTKSAASPGGQGHGTTVRLDIFTRYGVYSIWTQSARRHSVPHPSNSIDHNLVLKADHSPRLGRRAARPRASTELSRGPHAEGSPKSVVQREQL